jgi:hypothetical protein
MNPVDDPQDIGRQLGEDGTKSFLNNVEMYCAQEARRIALENRSPLVAAKAQLAVLAGEEQRIRETLHDAPQPGDINHLRRKKMLAWAVTVVLTVTGFFLAALAFAPFELGWQSYLFCLGIAMVLPFLIEKLLEGGRMDAFVKTLTGIAAVAGIASLMLLADVRGRILAHSMQNPETVTIDGASPDTAPPDDFYTKTLDPLRLATIFLSLAMELGAGLALREAMAKLPHDPETWQRLRDELNAVRGQMVVSMTLITAIESEPEVFEARFWKDFYKSMITQTVSSAMKKLLMGILVLTLLGRADAASPSVHTEMVIAVDLTKSVDVKGPDGVTEFQKNIDAVAGVLGQASPDTRVTIVGITGRSFGQPYILLRATVPAGHDYFHTKLISARQKLIAAWKLRSAMLKPTYMDTDIMGALEVAGEIFAERSSPNEHRVLIIFSDMRQHTRELDLETAAGIARAQHPSQMPSVLPNLSGADLYALGVDGSGESMELWSARKRLWAHLLRTMGGTVRKYSPMRGLTGLLVGE